MIDVVFADVPQVVELWHRYYELLANPPANENYQGRDHTYLLMLSAMARALGYHKLEQTDIDKFYSPQAHGNQLELNYKCHLSRSIMFPRLSTFALFGLGLSPPSLG